MRRYLADPHFREGFVEMLPACVGLVPFGLVCGVGAAAAGASIWGAIGMSAIIFSGAAQIIAAQLLAAGAPTAVIILTCVVMGLRFLMYSAAIAPHVRPLSPRLQQALAFFLNDQSFAAAIRRYNGGADPHSAGLRFLGGGVALWLFWQITNVVGYFGGNLVPASWSMEFAVPLCFIALIAPHFNNAPQIAAGLMAGVAVVALDGLPMRLNLIAAGAAGIVVGTALELAKERWTQR